MDSDTNCYFTCYLWDKYCGSSFSSFIFRSEYHRINVKKGDQMNKWELEFKIAKLIAESEEQRRFDEFYEKIPNGRIRHKTQESHLPLKFVTNKPKEGR